jgi:hypothetical protein
MYLIWWRPEEPQELTNPVNRYANSGFGTSTRKLGKLDACVVELCKQKGNSEVIYITLMRTSQPFHTGCSEY